MYGLVTILLDQRENVLTLPAAAIVRDGDKTFACCVTAGKIDRRPIELGLRSGDDIEILSGLDDGESVVLIRAESLQQDQHVEVNVPPPPK
jgi:membrane fusion protein (multidrug efflux system)